MPGVLESLELTLKPSTPYLLLLCFFKDCIVPSNKDNITSVIK